MTHACIYDIIKQDNEGILEVCRECKKRLLTRKDRRGRVEPHYLKEHIRDTAQPSGRTGKVFSKYYGDSKKRVGLLPNKLKRYED